MERKRRAQAALISVTPPGAKPLVRGLTWCLLALVLAFVGGLARQATAQGLTLSVQDVVVTEGHFGTLTAYVPVILSAPAPNGASVQFATASGTASAGSDYQATSGTLWFGGNDTLRTISIVVNGDVVSEGDEIVLVTLTNASGADIADGNAVVTIADDEGAPKPPLRSIWNVAQEGMPGMSGSAYGAGRYVLVGSREIWTSTNGLDWSPAANPAQADVRHVIYASGQFVAVGSGGILTSPDGLAWTQRSTRGAPCVAYGNGRYVAPGNPILISSNGVSWTEHTPPSGWPNWNSIAFGGGVFVAVVKGVGLSTSTDGLTWTPQQYPAEMALLRSVIFAAGKFWASAGGCCGTGAAMSSPDGINWTMILQRWETTGENGQGMTAAGPTGNLVAVLEHAHVYISDGGATIPCDLGLCWPGYDYRINEPGVTRDLDTITWGPPGFVAAGPGGAVFFLPQADYETWDDSKTWQNGTLRQSRLFTDVVWRPPDVSNSPGYYCAVGTAGLTATSANGREWMYHSVPLWTGPGTWPLDAWVTYANGRFVAVLYAGEVWIASSSDCETWTVHIEPSMTIDYHAQDIAYGNGVFLTVGQDCASHTSCNPGVLTSTDGRVWQFRPNIEDLAGARGVAFGDGRFVAVTEYPSPGRRPRSVLVSDDDGTTWSSFPAPFETIPVDIAFGNGLFVAVEHRIWTSPDGITWTPRTDGAAVSSNVCAYGCFYSGAATWTGDRFVVAGHDGQVLASPDGTSWTSNTPGTHHNLGAVAYSPDLDQLVALGESIATYSTGFEPPTVSVNDLSIAEGHSGSSTAVFSVVLSHPTNQPVGVAYTTAAGTATAGTDYEAVTTPVTVTFASESWIQTANVTVFGDTLPEPDQTFTVSLSAPINASIADGQATGTILDDEPVVTIADATVTEGDAGTTTDAVFMVSVSRATGPVTVDYFTSDFTARAPGDYDAVSGTLDLLPDGEGTATEAVSVPVHGDSVGETTERFFVNIGNATGARFARNSATGTIQNDEREPFLSVSDAAMLEGNAGTRTMLFTVSASWASDETITVGYAVTGVTATEVSDFVGATGTLTFNAGQVARTIAVTLYGDTDAEGDETLVVTLSDPVFATLDDLQGVGTIVDDESGPNIPLVGTWVRTRDGMNVSGLASNGTTYVAVGTGDYGSDEIWTSADATAWTRRENPDPLHRALSSVTFGGGRFVAVSYLDMYVGSDVPAILTSSDGMAWTLQSPGQNQADLLGVAYGNGLYVAVGSGGTILTSPDAATWTQRETPTTAQLNAVAFGSGLFVAVGDGRTVLTSTDGTEWAPRHVDSGIANTLYGIAHTDSQFVVVAGNASGAPHSGGSILTSSDGITWVARTIPTSEPLRTVTAGNGTIVAAGGPANGASPTVLTSTDGIAWTARTLSIVAGVSLEFNAVTHGGSGFLLGAGDGGLFVSTDGATWLDQTGPASRLLKSVAHDGTRYCAVGAYGGVASSVDGITWTNRTALDPAAYSDWRSVIWENGRFWAVGVSGSIMSSPNCMTWTARYPARPLQPGDPTGYLMDIVSGNGLLVAVGVSFPAPGQSASLILTSSDGGATWTAATPAYPGGSRHALTKVAYGNGRFVAAGNNTDMRRPFLNTSEDGLTWTLRAAPSGVSDLIFANGLFVGVGGQIWASSDGLAWSLRQNYLPSGDYFSAVGYGNGRFVALGSRGTTYTSSDALEWTSSSPVTEHDFLGVVHATNADRFVGVGVSVTAYGDYSTLIRVSDAPPVLEGRSSSVSLGFTVSLSSPSAQSITVQYATTDGTATAGSDYVAAAGTLTFLPGQMSKDLTVAASGDTLNEDDETVILNLSNPVNAMIVDGTGVGTILNDDDVPSLSIGDATAKEGKSGAKPTTMTFLVTLSSESGKTVAVTAATADGSAVAPADYQSVAPTTLTFAPGEKQKQVTVNIVADSAHELTETFFVRLTNPVNATLGRAQGTGTIIDR